MKSVANIHLRLGQTVVTVVIGTGFQSYVQQSVTHSASSDFSTPFFPTLYINPMLRIHQTTMFLKDVSGKCPSSGGRERSQLKFHNHNRNIEHVNILTRRTNADLLYFKRMQTNVQHLHATNMLQLFHSVPEFSPMMSETTSVRLSHLNALL